MRQIPGRRVQRLRECKAGVERGIKIQKALELKILRVLAEEEGMNRRDPDSRSLGRREIVDPECLGEFN